MAAPEGSAAHGPPATQGDPDLGALLGSLAAQAAALHELAACVVERHRELAAPAPGVERALPTVEASPACPDAAAGGPAGGPAGPSAPRPEEFLEADGPREEGSESGDEKPESDDEEGRDSGEEDAAAAGAPPNALEIHEVWKQRRRRGKQKASRGSLAAGRRNVSRVSLSADSRASLDGLARWRLARWAEDRFVVHPTSKKRLAWEFGGMVLVGYDLLTIPLITAYDLTDSGFLNLMAWVTAVFWSLDIVRTFFLGFHEGGRVQMAMAKIARRYLTTWLFVDLAMACVDWTILVAARIILNSEEGTDAGYMRLGRTLRFLRMARLLRLLKVHGTLAEAFERVQSETFRIFLGIARLLVYIILCNHVLACGFFGVSVLFRDEVGAANTWVDRSGLPERSFWYKYFTSLHWSLTQFTPASMEVVPCNAFERVYTVCTVLFALVTFSSFVSSLTGAMTELRNLNSEKLAKCMVLRRYLRENRIEASLTSRIWGWVEHKPTQRRRTRSADVEMLGMLPRRLQIELHQQIYEPVLIRHPFFHRFSLARPADMRFIYECLREMPVDIGHEVFVEGQASEHMLFVFEGSLSYVYGDPDSYADQEWQPPRRGSSLAAGSTEPDSPPMVRRPSGLSSGLQSSIGYASNADVSESDAVVVGDGSWLCEATLWFRWKHVGVLTAAAHSELIGLHAPRFLDVMACELRDIWEPGKYARLLLRFVEKHRVKICDIWADVCRLEDLAAATFDVDGEPDDGLRGSRWAQEMLPQLHPALAGLNFRQRISISSLLTTSTQGDATSRRSSVASGRSQGSLLSVASAATSSETSSSKEGKAASEEALDEQIDRTAGGQPTNAWESLEDEGAAGVSLAPKRASLRVGLRPSVSIAAAAPSGSAAGVAHRRPSWAAVGVAHRRPSWASAAAAPPPGGESQAARQGSVPAPTGRALTGRTSVAVVPQAQ